MELGFGFLLELCRTELPCFAQKMGGTGADLCY